MKICRYPTHIYSLHVNIREQTLSGAEVLHSTLFAYVLARFAVTDHFYINVINPHIQCQY